MCIRDRVRPARLRNHRVHDLAQQLGRHLRVGARHEPVPLSLQIQTQLRGVLDDPVMDDRDPAIHARMRMRVHIIGHTVRRPTCMPDRHRRLRQRIRLDIRHQIAQTTGLLPHPHPIHARRHQRHTRRIVPTILKPLQALQTHLKRLIRRTKNTTCITHNSTHAEQHNRRCCKSPYHQGKTTSLTKICKLGTSNTVEDVYKRQHQAGAYARQCEQVLDHHDSGDHLGESEADH